MHYQADVSDTVYRYDGSFQGFLCCVFESFARREIPAAVCTPQTEQLTLFALRDIPTDLLIALADFYHTSTDYILGRTNNSAPPQR